MNKKIKEKTISLKAEIARYKKDFPNECLLGELEQKREAMGYLDCLMEGAKSKSEFKRFKTLWSEAFNRADKLGKQVLKKMKE